MSRSKEKEAPMAIASDKQKALESAMIQVERQFGKGSIMKLGSRPIVSVPVISTGSLALDMALGIGGLPRGRVVEIFGPEASGKTTLALHVGGGSPEAGRRSPPSSTRSTRWTPSTPASSASTATTCSSPSPTPASRRSRSRHAGAQRRGRHPRHRLGGGPGAAGRDRGRDGRPAHGAAGAADVPGAAQAHGHHQQDQHLRHLHQPDRA